VGAAASASPPGGKIQIYVTPTAGPSIRSSSSARSATTAPPPRSTRPAGRHERQLRPDQALEGRLRGQLGRARQEDKQRAAPARKRVDLLLRLRRLGTRHPLQRQRALRRNLGTLQITQVYAGVGPRLSTGTKKGQCNESNNASRSPSGARSRAREPSSSAERPSGSGARLWLAPRSSPVNTLVGDWLPRREPIPAPRSPSTSSAAAA